MSVFNKIKPSDLFELIEICKPYFKQKVDNDLLIKSSYEMVKFRHGKNVLPKNNAIIDLEKRWYDSLKTNKPDYNVYDDPYYIADTWTCWVRYSRQSVKVLTNPTCLINKSAKDLIGDGTILDLGCGFGFTTLALKEVFEKSSVFGTNIETSYQYLVAKDVTKHKDISILPSFSGVKNVNLAFASEYFEHIERPIEHLYNIVKECSPKYFVIANGFNGIAIGHFKTYKHLNNTYSSKVMSKLFLKAMRMLGYKKLESNIWNNRPSVWARA